MAIPQHPLRALALTSVLLLLLALASLGQPRLVDSSPLDFSDGTLKMYDQQSREILLRHLRASALWQVGRVEGVWVARRRQVTGLLGEGQEGPPPGSLRLHGSAFPDNGDVLVQIALRFGPVPPTEGDTVSAGGGRHRIGITHEPPGVPTSRVFIVGSPTLHLDLDEQSGDLQRRGTQRALDEVNAELGTVLAGAEEIASQGYSTSQPAVSTQKLESEATLTLEDGSDSGLFEAVGYVATGEPGAIYLKAFSAQVDDKPLSQETLKERSLEYVGWSRTAGLGFFYNTDVQIYEGGRKHAYDARFELWFQPDSGAADRKLAQLTRAISGWER